MDAAGIYPQSSHAPPLMDVNYEFFYRSIKMDTLLIFVEEIYQSLFNKKPFPIVLFLEKVANLLDCEGCAYCELQNNNVTFIDNYFKNRGKTLKNFNFMCSESMKSDILLNKSYTLWRKPELLGPLFDKGIQSICCTSIPRNDRNEFLALFNGEKRGKFNTVFQTGEEKFLAFLSILFMEMEKTRGEVKIMKPTPSADPIQEAWQTYQFHEQKLLEKHKGEYAWIVGDTIEAIEQDRKELCRIVLERGQHQKGIIAKIEEEKPTEEIFSLNLD